MAPKPTLSFLEKVGVAVGFIKILSLVAISLAAVPFQRSKGPAWFSRHVKFAIFRVFTQCTSPKVMVATAPSTDEMYGKFASDHGLKADSIALPDGTQAHWLGDPSAEKMLLYLHGGGYLLPAVEGHFHLLRQTVRKVEQQGGKLAVLFLSYDLSIIAPYPRQLHQATALLRYTLTVLGRRPEDILLAGDSAGGNLLLALLSHTVHRHPQVDPLDLPGKFAGVALLSPWVTFDSSADAMRRNLHRDILALPVLKKWAALFQGDAASDFYLEPLSAPSDWWQGFPAKEVLIMAGGDELFVDDIAKFSKRFDAANSQTVTKIVPGEAHDHPVMEFLIKEPKSQQRRIFEDWILENYLKK